MDQRTADDYSWICDLYHLGQMVAREPTSDAALERILSHIAGKLGALTGCLAIREGEAPELTINAGIGLPAHVIGNRIPFGEGVLGWVAAHAEPVLINGDAGADPRFRYTGATRRPDRPPQSAMCLPLVAERAVIGALSLNRAPGDPPFTERDMDRAEIMISHVTVVVENARLHRSQERQLQALARANVRIAMVSEVMGKFMQAEAHMGDERAQDDYLADMLTDFTDISGGDCAVVARVDDQGRFESLVSSGLEEPFITQLREALGPDGCLERLFTVTSLTNIDDLHAEAGADMPRECPLHAALVAPLTADGHRYGLLILAQHSAAARFDASDELTTEMLANNLALLMDRTALVRELHHSNVALACEKAEQEQLIERLKEAKEQLLQSEKLAAIGQLSAGVAHEINNPVGYINSNISSMQGYVDDLFRLLDAYAAVEEALPEDAEGVAAARRLKAELDVGFLREDIADLMRESRDGVNRVKQIVQDLKDFSRVDHGEWEIADLHKGLDSTLNIVHNEVKYKAEVVKEYGELPQVECLASQINQVFMNLLVNAAQAIEERGTITLRTGTADEGVWVEVEDTGKGIEQQHLSKIFEPFFTTKAVGKGTGLGLSLSYGIVAKHGGRIDVASAPGEGSRFRVWLPLRRPEAAAEPEAARVAAAR